MLRDTGESINSSNLGSKENSCARVLERSINHRVGSKEDGQFGRGGEKEEGRWRIRVTRRHYPHGGRNDDDDDDGS